MPRPLRIRPAARALVIDPDRRVLLVHFDFVQDRLPNGLWACPGGGVDPGESLHEGVVRELREEVGLHIDDPGDPIWFKQHEFPMTNWDGQHDTYFLVRADAFEPRPRFTAAELRAEHVDGMRWWDYDELLSAQERYDRGDPGDPDRVVFSPRQLGHLVRDIVEGGPPATPIEVGPR